MQGSERITMGLGCEALGYAGNAGTLWSCSAPECFVSYSLRDCRVGLEDVTRLCQVLAQCPQLTEIE